LDEWDVALFSDYLASSALAERLPDWAGSLNLRNEAVDAQRIAYSELPATWDASFPGIICLIPFGATLPTSLRARSTFTSAASAKKSNRIPRTRAISRPCAAPAIASRPQSESDSERSKVRKK